MLLKSYQPAKTYNKNSPFDSLSLIHCQSLVLSVVWIQHVQQLHNSYHIRYYVIIRWRCFSGFITISNSIWMLVPLSDNLPLFHTLDFVHFDLTWHDLTIFWHAFHIPILLYRFFAGQKKIWWHRPMSETRNEIRPPSLRLAKYLYKYGFWLFKCRISLNSVRLKWMRNICTRVLSCTFISEY